MERIEFFELQMKILEKLFPREWFIKARKKSHPAYGRWNLCKQILQEGGIIRYPHQRETFGQIGRLVLDSYILVALTEGNVDMLKLGSLDLYGDEAVQEKIRSRVVNSEQFEDLMVELAFAAWHKSRKHTVIPWEREGLPDLKLQIPGVDVPILVECKRLRSGSKNRLTKVISKANSQIKAAQEPCYGVVVLDVSIPVGVAEVENDELPNQLQDICSTVQSALSGKKNRSVGMAILVWDDSMILGEPPDKTQVAFRRRHLRIRHRMSRKDILETVPLFEGFTTLYTLYWKQREQPIREYAFTDYFRKECEDKFNTDMSKVVEAIQKCDRGESIRFNSQKEMILFSRHIMDKKREFNIVALSEKVNQRLIVHLAFKIFDDLCPEVYLLSPVQLLARFASSYGLPVTIGDLTSRFILAHKIPVKSSDPTKIVTIHNPENHSFLVNFLFRIDEVNGQYFANCALLFCIDSTRYLKWICEG